MSPVVDDEIRAKKNGPGFMTDYDSYPALKIASVHPVSQTGH